MESPLTAPPVAEKQKFVKKMALGLAILAAAGLGLMSGFRGAHPASKSAHPGFSGAHLSLQLLVTVLRMLLLMSPIVVVFRNKKPVDKQAMDSPLIAPPVTEKQKFVKKIALGLAILAGGGIAAMKYWVVYKAHPFWAFGLSTFGIIAALKMGSRMKKQ